MMGGISIKHHSFVYTQLNDQTFLFQAIQFRISHFLAFSLDFKLFYLTHRPYQVFLLQARVNLEALAIKEYSAFPKAPALL